MVGRSHDPQRQWGGKNTTINKTGNFVIFILCVVSCDSGVSALISRILNKWQLLHLHLPPPPHSPTLHVPMAACQQSYIYPSSRSHPRSRTSKAHAGTRTHRRSGISCSSPILTHSRTHTDLRQKKQKNKNTTQCQTKGNMYSTYVLLMIHTQESKAAVQK